MTQQEFVKKLSRMEGKMLFGLAEESESMLIAKEEFKNGYFNGLTKGLEIAELFQQFVEHDYFKVMDKYMLKYGRLEDVESHKTRSELLTIFLTEKYGQ